MAMYIDHEWNIHGNTWLANMNTLEIKRPVLRKTNSLFDPKVTLKSKRYSYL